ncbi:hypothetical protein ACE1B6_16510 [Aerosakkonemataceae cyanobacterium BLCC-F154]|uniref:Glycosyltransferase family 1 protein n=1 Tax=Floridaenema fluviatile BLCC-F154 TaxID=3153640 RepID=A0ABV4YFH0_9CYAN
MNAVELSRNMTNNLPPIYFYLPNCEKLTNNMLEDPEVYLPGVYQDGVYCWTLQTYLRLKADNFPCQLVGKMPTEGIVLAHRSSLTDNFQPGAKILLVCMLADKAPHPNAQIHVVLNREEEIFKHSGKIWQSAYMPHWRQPGLIPRDAARGDKFENVAYFGHERNLAPELKTAAWNEQIDELGLNFQIVNRDRWHDFSNVDVVLAVRSFDRQYHTSKPATKLYNTWHAGIPAILGCETAYQAERKSDLDYIEVSSLNEVLLALKRLRDEQNFRNAMVENGRIRSEETQPNKVVKKWRNFLIEKAVPVYEKWCNTTRWKQKILFKQQFFSLKMLNARINLQNQISCLFS